MDDRYRPDWEEANEDHWDSFAVAMELTIEGHRLIAEEIGFELRLLWRGATVWLRELAGTLLRRRSSPPA